MGDLFAGKKIKKDREVDMLKSNLRQGIGAQSDAFKRLRKETGEDAGGIVRQRAAREREQVRGSAADRLRELRGSIARRGLQNTSLGLSGERAISQNSADQMNRINASVPERIRNLRTQQTDRLFQAGTQGISSNPSKLNARTRRVGGLFGEGGLAELGVQAAAKGFGASLCWVARAVFGEDDPRWVQARHYILNIGPSWFRVLYENHGEAFAEHVKESPALRIAITPVFKYFAWRARAERGSEWSTLMIR